MPGPSLLSQLRKVKERELEKSERKKTRVLRTLTHSRTRINPKGNLSTWNVPSDTICIITKEHDQQRHLM